MKRSVVQTLFLVSILICSRLALAGPAADSLGECLKDNTTGKDRKNMVMWMFMSMAAHPDMQPLSTISDKMREDIAHTMGDLFTRLLTENCRAQAKNAFDTEGAEGFGSAFEQMGRIAMQDMMIDPSVKASLGSYTHYMDRDKFRDVFTK